MNYSMTLSLKREPYPTDLNNDEWLHIRELIRPDRDVGRKRAVDEREIVNAILYVWQSGCAWRMLPHDLPPWPTVYYYFCRWRRDGTLDAIRMTLREFKRQAL